MTNHGSTIAPSQTTPGFTPSQMSTVTYSNPSHKSSSSTTSKKGISAGVVIGIIAVIIIVVGVAFMASGFIRRRMRRARHRRRHRDTFMRPSILIPDEPVPVMGSRNALALARSTIPDSGVQMTEQRYEQNNGADQPAGTDDRYTNGGVYDQYYNSPTEPGAAYIQPQQPYRYDSHASPIVSRELTTSPTQVQEQQYADLSRALTTPPPSHLANGMPISSFPDNPASDSPHAPSGNGPEMSLQNPYGSLNAQNPVLDHPARSGTPVDPNPQQTYLGPAQDPFGGKPHPLRNVVSADDPYGGV